MRRTAPLSTLLVAVVTVWPVAEAHALGPIDVEVALKFGVGTAPGGEGSGLNPLNLGDGARGGVALSGLYGGLAVMEYYGRRSEGSSCVVTPTGWVPDGSTGSTSAHALMYGVEGGYGVKLGARSLLRAQLGVGDYAEMIDVSGSSSAAASEPFRGTRNSVYLEPGLTAMFSFARVLFAGFDVNVLLLPNDAKLGGGSSFDAAFTAHGQFGLKF
jgi:hypothetical protein